MPMIDVQRRHQTIFRIRFGEKLSNRPTKLTDSIRITSANPDVVDAFTDVYGGTRRPWEQHWEAKLPTTSLNILVLPGQSISQWWEKYRGSVCERRCDGAKETKSGKPCMCTPDVEARTASKTDCTPTTRVSVICPDVAVVGSGMFVCHGLVGAETLPQSIAVAEAALSRGLMVPAVLRVVEFKGLTHFIVPQIEVVGVSFNALAAAAESGQLQHATRELEAPAADRVAGAGPRFTPVPPAAVAAAPARSVRDQFGEFEDQAAEKTRARDGRSNAALKLPATGVPVRPRGAAVSPTAAVASDGGTGDGAESAPARSGDVPAPSPGTADIELVNGEGAQNIAIRCADAGIDDSLRPAFLWAVSDGRYRSSKAVPVDDLGSIYGALQNIRAGVLVLHVDPDGEREPQLLAPGKVPADSVESPPAEIMWRAALKNVEGVAGGKLLRKARDLATERGITPPTSLDDIPAVLNVELRSWLDQHAAA